MAFVCEAKFIGDFRNLHSTVQEPVFYLFEDLNNKILVVINLISIFDPTGRNRQKERKLARLNAL